MNARSLMPGALLILSGCAGLPEHTFNPDAAVIQSIAVATPQHDNELLLRYRKDQLESIDLFTPLPIAKVFAYLAKENREADFTDQFGNSAISYAQRIQAELTHMLGESGFEVTTAVEAEPEAVARDRHGLLRKIPMTTFAGADALLETSGEIGFTAAGRGKPFQPTLWLTVRLTAADGRVLMQDQVLFNPPDNSERGVLLYPSADLKFDDRQALVDSDLTVAALEQAITQVASEVMFLLRGPVYASQ